MVKPIERRSFLKSSAGVVATAAVTSGSAASLLSRADANDTIRAGVVGLRGRGKSHLKGFSGLPKVEVVALCDVDESIMAERASDLEKLTGRKARTYTDMRRLLEAKDIDVVGFATPNHWHALGGIWACQAGKDVYVEKPCSHNIFEGRKLVEAARRYGRIVQHGTQSRSSVGVRDGIQKLREGVIGDVYMAKGLCYKWRKTIGHTPEEPAPNGVHYDLWLGPAPQRPYSRNRFHYNWHWHWDYGNGDIGNQGVHEMDMARWGLGVGLPTKVQSSGGHYMFDDDQETPNCQLATFEYPDQKKQLVFEVRHWITNHEAGLGQGESNEVGVLFLGSEGYMVMQGGKGYRTYLGRKQETGPDPHGNGQPLCQLHPGRPFPPDGGSERRDRRGPPLFGALSPGEHGLPHRPDAELRSRDRDRPGRRRGQRPADARLPGSLRGSRSGLSRPDGESFRRSPRRRT